jgi:thiamine-phosphate pyrophosphorylase
LGADGLHVSGSVAAVRDAVARLKPDLIVGAGDIRSRHDAMQKGEAGADYILFGPLSGHIDAAQRELAEWWAETMEVPCVLADPSAATPVASRCEFKGIGLIAGEQSA